MRKPKSLSAVQRALGGNGFNEIVVELVLEWR
jgi:hypothetical protein